MTLVERYNEAEAKAEKMWRNWMVKKDKLEGNERAEARMKVAYAIRDAHELAIQLSQSFATRSNQHHGQLLDVLR